MDIDIPSHGSGSVFAARSSMENFMSCPFSSLDSGSAFMSQYWRPDGGAAGFEPAGFGRDSLGFLIGF